MFRNVLQKQILLVGIAILCGCAGSTTATSASKIVAPPVIVKPVVVEPVACEPEIDLLTEAAVRKLALGNEWHVAARYQVSLEAYESVLAEHASLLADAYALAGIIALRLDRDNPDYSRESATTVSWVLEQRIQSATKTEAANEARILWFGAKLMLNADVSKDTVVAENRRLTAELAQRDEALQRLRELTVGR